MAIDNVSFGSMTRPQQGIDPNKYAQQYADKNGISLEEAKQQLKTQHGDPAQQTGSSSATSASSALSTGDVDGSGRQSNLPPEAWELQSLGIPVEVIQQGDDAIKTYAEDIDNLNSLMSTLRKWDF